MGAGSGRDATSPVRDVRGAPAMPAAAARPSALKGGRLASVTSVAGAGSGIAAASSPLGPAAGVDRSSPGPGPAHSAGAGAYSRATAAAAAAASAGRSQGRFSDRLASALEAEADVSESSRALNRAAAAGLRVRF